jgi:pimeloyl-ACP methyl ester carboxylesterase
MPSFDRLIDLPRGPVRVRARGEGPPLLWSHGVFFPIDVDNESTLGRVLESAPGFTVIRWDARGHGSTPPAATAEEHRWDRLGDDVIALADALGLARFAAGGISMGAAVTLHAALKAPDRFAAMMLLAMPTAWETRPAEQRRYRDLLAFGAPAALAAHVQEDLDALFPKGDLPASLRAMVAHLRASTWPALERVILGASASDMPDRADLARRGARRVVAGGGLRAARRLRRRRRSPRRARRAARAVRRRGRRAPVRAIHRHLDLARRTRCARRCSACARGAAPRARAPRTPAVRWLLSPWGCGRGEEAGHA